VVRKLTGRESDAAQESHRSQVAAGNVKAWAATFRKILEKGATNADVLKALADPLTGYDRFVVARAGLVSWSYPESMSAKLKAGEEDLDDEAVDFIATAVLRLTKPTLFQTAEEAATAQKELQAVASPA
jgi:hypothetical protein